MGGGLGTFNYLCWFPKSRQNSFSRSPSDRIIYRRLAVWLLPTGAAVCTAFHFWSRSSLVGRGQGVEKDFNCVAWLKRWRALIIERTYHQGSITDETAEIHESVGGVGFYARHVWVPANEPRDIIEEKKKKKGRKNKASLEAEPAGKRMWSKKACRGGMLSCRQELYLQSQKSERERERWARALWGLACARVTTTSSSLPRRRRRRRRGHFFLSRSPLSSSPM